MELATGVFPYINCKTDFEVLAKVLQEDPPRLPRGQGFSMDFCHFVCQWSVICIIIESGSSAFVLSSNSLTKDYKRRPKYKKLLVRFCFVFYLKIDDDFFIFSGTRLDGPLLTASCECGAVVCKSVGASAVDPYSDP